MKRKGQAAIEFMVLAVMVALFMLTAFVAIASRQFDVQREERSAFFDSLCTEVADKINNAFNYGNGFAQSVELTPAIFGREYNISINSTTLRCVMGGVIARRLVNESVTQGEIAKGKRLVLNKGGRVVIT